MTKRKIKLTVIIYFQLYFSLSVLAAYRHRAHILPSCIPTSGPLYSASSAHWRLDITMLAGKWHTNFYLLYLCYVILFYLLTASKKSKILWMCFWTSSDWIRNLQLNFSIHSIYPTLKVYERYKSCQIVETSLERKQSQYFSLFCGSFSFSFCFVFVL